MAKERVAVLFGGVSSEHDVSCISASSVVSNLPENKYEVIKIGITKKGRWLLYPGGTDKMLDGTWPECPDCVPAIISPDRTTHGIIINNNGDFDVLKVDMVFPVLHGQNGEDGTVQGLFDLAGIPYVGCNLISSAMCMDKAVANTVFASENIPHTPWLSYTHKNLNDIAAVEAEIVSKLKFPLFIKPSVGGSSVGISKVKAKEDIKKALYLALSHCDKVVVEQGIIGSEVECAVFGNSLSVNTDIFCSVPGEIVSCNEEMYDYEAKYLSGDASQTYIPARFSDNILETIKKTAIKAYTALGCSGLSRVDFFVCNNGDILINEINTMPGFTPISMYAKLMNYCGNDFAKVLDNLIVCAKERFHME